MDEGELISSHKFNLPMLNELHTLFTHAHTPTHTFPISFDEAVHFFVYDILVYSSNVD